MGDVKVATKDSYILEQPRIIKLKLNHELITAEIEVNKFISKSSRKIVPSAFVSVENATFSEERIRISPVLNHPRLICSICLSKEQWQY